MSKISGKGFGDSHDWECEQQGSWDKVALWYCKSCKKGFRHLYGRTPDIFQAIKEYGIPDICPSTKGE